MSGLSRLSLRDFRNYETADLSFSPSRKLQVFCGCNGQGKTNLLEAIYYLSLLRSFRCRLINNLVRFGHSKFELSACVLGESGEEELEVLYGSRRRLRHDGCDLTQASEYINQYLCVALVPEDLQLVKGAPGDRRRFADIFLSQMDPLYLHQLQGYRLCLKSRNEMLRQADKYGPAALAAYDQVLIEKGVYLTQARTRFAQQLQAEIKGLSRLFSPDESVTITIDYQSALLRESLNRSDGATMNEVFRSLLERSATRDREEARTTCGPHRDELVFKQNAKLLGVYGSEGQCRLMSLALRLACVRLTLKRAAMNIPVILLVDDVFGELDEFRRREFFRLLDGADQTFIACTEVPAELSEGSYQVHQIQDGHILSTPECP
jgi:DNA replication and repair protein RecF